ncbi:13675_t:CDS:2, partial [Cetraspora pellucida]
MSNLQLEILYDHSHGESNMKNHLNWNCKWHNIIWSNESNFKYTLNEKFDKLRLVKEVLEQAEVERWLHNSLDKSTNIDNLKKKVIAA